MRQYNETEHDTEELCSCQRKNTNRNALQPKMIVLFLGQRQLVH